MKSRNLLEGMGAALLALLPYLYPFLSPSNLEFYHHRLPINTLIGGLLLDLLGVAALATAFFIAVQHLPPLLQRIVNPSVAGVVLWRFMDVTDRLLSDPENPSAHWFKVRRLVGVAIPLLLITLGYIMPRLTRPIVRMVRLALAAFAFSALWCIPQLLFLTLAQPSAERLAYAYPSAPAAAGSHHRIVWILFDELSFNQVFDHPASGVDLPNLERLRLESVSFSELKPAGFFTNKVIPSLFLGRRIDEIRSTVDGALWYRDEPHGRWLAYDPKSTVFGLAQSRGWNSGVAGWLNPYCRILAPTLQDCYWAPAFVEMEAGGASAGRSAFANAVAASWSFLTALVRPGNAVRTKYADRQIQAYRNVLGHAQSLIENNQIQFIFLHFPIPHPPGIYDRKRHLLRPSGTYLDNLVLAGDTLGVLLREIHLISADSQTTVIVSSDHSWRIKLWRPAGYGNWSSEEERASGGRFDERPVLLIHFPGQRSGADIKSDLPALLQHDLIAGMLRDQINNPEDVADFLRQHSR